MGKKNIKIKSPSSTNEGNFRSINNPNTIYDGFKHPIFCFKYLVKKWDLNECDKEEKAALIDKLSLLSQLDWTDIHIAPRHGNGTEEISRNAIKAGIPSMISNDTKIYAIRFSGKKPFLGYKSGFIFHIIWIDNKFKLYSHS